MENTSVARELQHHFGKDHNETYLSWPDRPHPRMPGDSRVAIAPWLAHKALGETYKWMLYGDDDTLFFVENVKTLLRDYDPELPYVISDVLWHKRKRYAMEAPRCLPCHVTQGYVHMAAVRPDKDPPKVPPGEEPYLFYAPPVPPPGCPCIPELACEYSLNVTGRRRALAKPKPRIWSPESEEWGYPEGYPSKCDYPHFHGGSGVLVSVGAMRKVSYEAALRCYYDDTEALTSRNKTLKAEAHGDRMTSLCFWLHGVAITDPGHSMSKHELTNIALRVMDSRTASVGALEQVRAGLVADEWLWSTLYMAAAHMGHAPGAVEATWALAAAHNSTRDRVVEMLKQRKAWGFGETDAQRAEDGQIEYQRKEWRKKGRKEWHEVATRPPEPPIAPAARGAVAGKGAPGEAPAGGGVEEAGKEVPGDEVGDKGEDEEGNEAEVPEQGEEAEAEREEREAWRKGGLAKRGGGKGGHTGRGQARGAATTPGGGTRDSLGKAADALPDLHGEWEDVASLVGKR
ncbi:hypothetical protein HYH03_017251 [Edaphochlamys debaryana]|uniref:Uncharacterized protein n=1 Tax=Edaphochlamys debaryana TaxID=47281 RepID=A0A835XIC3_9CHLO|nr:hypothetical protein HYH03_017251 [Edaphochlamys debaryana]|eukprot:KAG2483930.1 hypothetical protein HYH03_017251 [Edaphochlamys debaryana]